MKVLVTKFVRVGMSSAHDPNFKYPTSGNVKCPDWVANNKCGNGLHGWKFGLGDYSTHSYASDDLMLVLEIEDSSIIDLGGKVKFLEGNVVFCGDRSGATKYLKDRGHSGIVYGCDTVGNNGVATTGDYGISTSGDYGTSISGYRGISTSGDCGISTSGDSGTSTSGYYGTSTSGDYGTSTSGDCGTSTSGYRGTSTSGNDGTSTSGDYGKAKSGVGGKIVVKYRDGRERLAVGYVGEDGIKPDVFYKVDGGKLVEA